MTREAWKNKRREYQRYLIAASQGESWWSMAEVERIGPLYIENATKEREKIAMYVEIFFKSGTSEKQYFDLERKFSEERVTSIFGGRTVKKPWTAQQYFDHSCTAKATARKEEWKDSFFRINKG